MHSVQNLTVNTGRQTKLLQKLVKRAGRWIDAYKYQHVPNGQYLHPTDVVKRSGLVRSLYHVVT
jgi:hypothetical protein